ncbi:MAG: (d)CMP kinase [Deltaproteobacteria bacterium]|nr:(d)CMP kinase [Deltaproteobacteria bacterium]
MIITIDGPSGVGKSTITSLLSQKLGIVKLESGALYRALAYKAIALGFQKESHKIVSFLPKTKLRIEVKDHHMHVILDGTCVDSFLRDEKVGEIASQVSKLKEVREFLLGVQREIGKKFSLVAEGRDMGSVVFPQAEFKFFLDANPKARAQRRYLELKDQGVKVELKTIDKALQKRDQEDEEREHSPLIVPQGAHIIDTTNLSIDAVLEEIYKVVHEAFGPFS